ncbi:MAG: hypothetical protein U1E75_00100 [Alicycliphilus sp.]
MAYRQRGSSILATMTLRKALDQSAALLPLAQALQGRPELQHAGLRLALAQHAARSLIGPCAMPAGGRQRPGMARRASAAGRSIAPPRHLAIDPEASWREPICGAAGGCGGTSFCAGSAPSPDPELCARLA